MTTAAIPEAKLVISRPGITWLANNTANPVIAHRIRNPFMPASYRPCGLGLKPQRPDGIGGRLRKVGLSRKGSGFGSGIIFSRRYKAGLRTIGKSTVTPDAHQDCSNTKGRLQVECQNARIRVDAHKQIPLSPLSQFLPALSLQLASGVFSTPFFRRRKAVFCQSGENTNSPQMGSDAVGEWRWRT